MAATAVQFTDADASFLVEVLYHLTSPLTVNARALASHKGLSPNAIAVRVSRIKKRYNLEISCQGTTDPNNSNNNNKSPHKRQKKITSGELSLESGLLEFDDIPQKAIAAPPTPLRSACRAVTLNAEGSPRKRRSGGNASSPRLSKKANLSPTSSQQSELVSAYQDVDFDNQDSEYIDE